MSTHTSPSAAGTSVRLLLDSLFRQLSLCAPQPDDHRLDPRYPVHAPITVGVRIASTQSFKPLYRAWVLELSRGGLSFLVETDLPTGMQVCVGLDSLVGSTCVVPMRLVYCNQLLPSTYRVGGAFVLGDEPELKLAH